MSYEEFFGLSMQPFSNVPDDRFYFNSEQHDQALLRLKYAAETMKGLAVLVGDLGTGKTTLARRLLLEMDDSIYETALLIIVHPDISSLWLLRKIASQFELDQLADTRVEILNQLFLRLKEIKKQNKKAVVLIDEANMLRAKEIMEELRGLLNLEDSGQMLITFILFGLPEIDQNLSLDVALLQRVALKFSLRSLKYESTLRYIQHRMKIAGAKESVFTDEAYGLIHRASTGIPRLINTICDNSLLEAFLLKKSKVDLYIVREVVNDLGLLQTRTSIDSF
ncbi:MAG: AAA family ATPase [Candidatus Coatesbacteria bacterium]|nr:AAA family ATPase [Candidatus Coatesbacteria bacterium]